MRILVTGGCGFIGSHFIEYILENTDWKIYNVDLMTYAGVNSFIETDRYKFYRMDIGDEGVREILNQVMPDYVINFAAESHVDRSIDNPMAFINTNIVSTYKFVSYIQEYYEKVNENVRFVHVSTDEVYGHLALEEPPFTETTAYSPNSPYSATKASSDHIIHAFNKTYGLPAIITNCSNNYGPRQFLEKFIPVIIHNTLQGKRIPVYGSGMNIRDWLYVTDHCEALYLVLKRGRLGEKYNIGGNTEKTNLDVVRTILSSMNESESLIQNVTDRKGHDFRYAIDSSKIQKELGWKPKHTFEMGIEKTINWYREHL